MDDPADRDLARLVAALNHDDLPGDTTFPGGYPGQIELALIDAVLSIRARYGTWPRTGVGKRVMAYKAARGTDRCDDLDALATFPSDQLLQICGTQSTGGRSKADAIQEGARRLSSAGLRHAADLEPEEGPQKRAYTSTRGLGPVTWSYLRMLLGQPNVKPDRMIIRYTANAVGHAVTAKEARALVTHAARKRQVDTSDLDHAIWRFQRNAR